jgi:RNA polymerase sigma-70 factor (ECF subfamily)
MGENQMRWHASQERGRAEAAMVRHREDLDSPLAPVLQLEDVYREHFDFVYRMAARLGGPAIDAEDAAQEVFLIVARKLHTYDGSSLVSTWLYGITLNVVRSLRRRSRLRRLFEHDQPKADVPIQSVDRAEVMEAHRIAYAILEKLAPKKREAFILAEFEGLSCEEIAQMTGTREQTVWSRLHYARKEFAERLEKRKQGGRA